MTTDFFPDEVPFSDNGVVEPLEIADYDNQVAMIGYYGSDKTHCLSAWQSTTFDVDPFGDLADNTDNIVDYLFNDTVACKKKTPAQLLHYLATNKHHTPFEKSTLHFQVRADIATHIHFLKHRIGVSINTESARYKELEDKYYLPSDWAEFDGVKIDVNALESMYITVFDDKDNKEILEDELVDVLDWYARLGHELYHVACDKLSPVVGRKRAKETARYFLPYCKQLDFDVMFNFRSFMHFIGLRMTEQAQKEVNIVAQRMLYLVANLPGHPFELSLQAFGVDTKQLQKLHADNDSEAFN